MKYYWDDQFKECDIGGACVMYGRGIKYVWGFGGEKSIWQTYS